MYFMYFVRTIFIHVLWSIIKRKSELANPTGVRDFFLFLRVGPFPFSRYYLGLLLVHFNLSQLNLKAWIASILNMIRAQMDQL